MLTTDINFRNDQLIPQANVDLSLRLYCPPAKIALGIAVDWNPRHGGMGGEGGFLGGEGHGGMGGEAGFHEEEGHGMV
jgi:hypothetical protein